MRVCTCTSYASECIVFRFSGCSEARAVGAGGVDRGNQKTLAVLYNGPPIALNMAAAAAFGWFACWGQRPQLELSTPPGAAKICWDRR